MESHNGTVQKGNVHNLLARVLMHSSLYLASRAVTEFQSNKWNHTMAPYKKETCVLIYRKRRAGDAQGLLHNKEPLSVTKEQLSMRTIVVN